MLLHCSLREGRNAMNRLAEKNKSLNKLKKKFLEKTGKSIDACIRSGQNINDIVSNLSIDDCINNLTTLVDEYGANPRVMLEKLAYDEQSIESYLGFFFSHGCTASDIMPYLNEASISRHREEFLAHGAKLDSSGHLTCPQNPV